MATKIYYTAPIKQIVATNGRKNKNGYYEYDKTINIIKEQEEFYKNRWGNRYISSNGFPHNTESEVCDMLNHCFDVNPNGIYSYTYFDENELKPFHKEEESKVKSLIKRFKRK